MSSEKSLNATDRSPSPPAKKHKFEISADSSNENEYLFQHLFKYFDPYQTSYLEDFIALRSYLEKLQDEHSNIDELLKTWCAHRKKTVEIINNLPRNTTPFDFCGQVIFFSSFGCKTLGVIIGRTSITRFFEKEPNETCSNALITGDTILDNSSKIVRYAFSKTYEAEIKEVLEEDQDLTNSLRKSMHISHEVKSLFCRLFHFNISLRSLPNVIKICVNYFKVLDEEQSDVQNFFEDIRHGKFEGIESITNEVADSLKRFQSGNPELLKPLRKICDILEESPYIFEYLEFGSENYDQLVGQRNRSFIFSMCLGASFLALEGAASVVERRKLFYSIDILDIMFSIPLKILERNDESIYSNTLKRIQSGLQSELILITKRLKK